MKQLIAVVVLFSMNGVIAQKLIPYKLHAITVDVPERINVSTAKNMIMIHGKLGEARIGINRIENDSKLKDISIADTASLRMAYSYLHNDMSEAFQAKILKQEIREENGLLWDVFTFHTESTTSGAETWHCRTLILKNESYSIMVGRTNGEDIETDSLCRHFFSSIETVKGLKTDDQFNSNEVEKGSGNVLAQVIVFLLIIKGLIVLYVVRTRRKKQKQLVTR